MTITTAHFLTSVKTAFSRYCIDIESVQNMYQVDLLFSLESYQIHLICISDRKWYDIYQISFGWRKSKWKCFWYCYHFSTIIEPLSFLTSKTLLLLFLQNSYFWMFSSTFTFLLIFYFEYLLLANTILHLTYCFWFSTINGFVVFHYVGEFLLFFFQEPCYIYINKPTYADPVIKRSSPKWVFCKYSKSCRKNISLSELIFANFEFIRESLWK